MNNVIYPYKQVKLPFNIYDISSQIDEKTLNLEYDIYINAINKVNEFGSIDNIIREYALEEILFNPGLINKDHVKEVIFYGGIIYNYELFFENITNTKQNIHGNFRKKVLSKYSSVCNFYNEIIKCAKDIAMYGSISVAMDNTGEIHIIGCVDNDTTIPLNMCPLMVIITMEHAYLYKYGMDITKYLCNIFQIINYDEVENRYNNCLKKI